MIDLLGAGLAADAAVAALVGDRVGPVRRRQGDALPEITLTRVSGAPLQSHKGPASLSVGRVQIDLWAESYPSARAVRAAVLPVLASAPASIAAVKSVRQLAERDLSERESGVFRISLDFEVWHEEP